MMLTLRPAATNDLSDGKVRLRPLRQVIGRQMRASLNYLQRFPSAQLLAHLQLCTALYVTACLLCRRSCKRKSRMHARFNAFRHAAVTVW